MHLYRFRVSVSPKSDLWGNPFRSIETLQTTTPQTTTGVESEHLGHRQTLCDEKKKNSVFFTLVVGQSLFERRKRERERDESSFPPLRKAHHHHHNTGVVVVVAKCISFCFFSPIESTRRKSLRRERERECVCVCVCV